jgi:predicted nucleic-acid-binding protein
MRAVDTNLLVRLIARDDAAQVEAAEAFVAGGAWVSQLVLAETIWVLDAVHGRSPQQLAAAIELLLNHQQLSIQESDVVLRALDQFRKRPGLGFSDCLVLEIARKAGHLPLGTFDRQLSKLAGTQRL